MLIKSNENKAYLHKKEMNNDVTAFWFPWKLDIHHLFESNDEIYGILLICKTCAIYSIFIWSYTSYYNKLCKGITITSIQMIKIENYLSTITKILLQ